MSTVLVTGGAGFLGWHTVRHLLESEADTRVRTLDALTYAGSRAAVADLGRRFGERHEFVRGSVVDAAAVRQALDGVEVVLHLAAESHVDRSIRSAPVFVETNVQGTQVLLDAARAASVRRFVQVSTDEVYGHLPLDAWDGVPFREEDPLAPRSPYAASKAAGDLLALAAFETHGLPVVVTRGSNAYGPGQYPEKLIPRAIECVRRGQPVPIYGDGRQVREWVHAEDQARGIVSAARRGVPGRIYNLGGGEPRTNLELVAALLRVMGAPPDRIEHVADRPGHDLRYALDGERAARELDWRPRRSLTEALATLPEWYSEHGATWWS